MAIVRRETDYALRALTHLVHAGDFVPVSTLAQEEAVPEDFLRKIMQTLLRTGLVESRQGPFGGYRLAERPVDVTLREVLEAVQGPLVMNECFETPGICQRTSGCPFREQLASLQALLAERMDAVSLEDIAGRICAGEGTKR